MATSGRGSWNKQVRIDGLTEAYTAFDRIPVAFKNEVMDTIETGAAIIESEAKRKVPVDEGDLSRSIGTNIRDDGMQAAVGSGLVYAPFIEFGWVYSPAQPYLYPAFRWGSRYIRKRMNEWAASVANDVSGKIRVRARRSRRRPS